MPLFSKNYKYQMSSLAFLFTIQFANTCNFGRLKTSQETETI